MTIDLSELGNIITQIAGVIGAIAAAAYGIYQKWIKPWAERIDARTESTDNAVNHGRMQRVEEMLKRGGARMDRMEDRSDRIEARLDALADQSGDRFGRLEDGRQTILKELRKQ